MNNSRNKGRAKLGCGFMIALGLLLCVLFFINLTFTRAFLTANFPEIDYRISQATYSVVPILLLFLEFWAFDTMTNRYQGQ